MSRRRISADLGLALDVRRLQERAALLELKTRIRAADVAREDLGQAEEAQARCEISWREALDCTAFDPGSIQLWRAETDAAGARASAALERLQARRQEERDHRRRWDQSLRLAEAVGSVARTAARAVSRADEERRLRLAEDARNVLRPRR